MNRKEKQKVRTLNSIDEQHKYQAFTKEKASKMTVEELIESIRDTIQLSIKDEANN